MVSLWYSSASGVLLLALSLTSCLTTSGGALTEHGTSDEDTPLPKVTSRQGTLQGVNMVTHRNRTIYGFKGIPYAEPPVGDLRFKAPVAARAWDGTFDASSEPNDCPQMRGGDEDCLYLHVYTPKLPTSDESTLLPVIVYLFGGGFRQGSITPKRHGPYFLLDKDVLLVVPNFRLGVLGYLTTGDEVSPGNYGLKDIVLALKWVQDNIQYFGGDPKEVTIAGGSAGAASVSLLALADSTNGLFHRCITDSGSALNLELSRSAEFYVNRTYHLAEHFGCLTSSSKLLVDCLRSINASQLIDTNDLFYVWGSLPNSVWFPTTEPDIEGALLTDTPTNLFAAGKIRDVPWLSLVAKNEGLDTTLMLYEDADLFEDFLDKIDLILPARLGYSGSVENVTAFTAALKSYYLNDLTADRSVLLKNVTELIADGLFYYPAYHSLQQQLVLGSSPLYFGCFEYRGVFSFSYLFGNRNPNYTFVSHSDESIYLFKNLGDSLAPAGSEYSKDDWSMVDTMVQLYTSFVINGKPTIEDSDATTVWEPYSSANNYLRIGNQSDTALEMKYDLYIERMQFWSELMSSPSGKFRN